MTRDEQNLLDLLAEINRLEMHCRCIRARESVPVEIYELIGALRDKIAAWGTKQILVSRKKP